MQFARRYLHCSKGIAAIEFAFLAPLLVALLLGSVELTRGFWADNKVDGAASLVGDLLSRENSLDATRFGEIMSAVPTLLSGHDLDDARVEVLSVLICDDPNNPPAHKYFVLWSRLWRQSTNQVTALITSPADSELIQQNFSETIIDSGDTLISLGLDVGYTSLFLEYLGPGTRFSANTVYIPRNVDRIAYSGIETSPPQTCADLL